MQKGLIVAGTTVFAAAMLFGAAHVQQDRAHVDAQLMATYERIAPAGSTIQTPERPVDIALDGDRLWIKESGGVRVIDKKSFKEIAHASSPGGASLTGLLVTKTGVLFSNSENLVHEYVLEGNKLSRRRDITFAKDAFPTGMAWSEPSRKFLVCLSIKNQVVEVDYESGKVLRTFETDIAPYQVVVANGSAFVTCQGGRRAVTGDTTQKTTGTDMPLDESGHATNGVVNAISLADSKVSTIKVGLQPGAISFLKKRSLLVVANANDDSISFVDSRTRAVVSTFITKLDPKLPFGSMPNGITASDDEKTLYVSLAGNNTIEVINVSDVSKPAVTGFVPSGWFPAALVQSEGNVFAVDVKGIGSRRPGRAADKGRNSHDATGLIQKIGSNEWSNLSSLSKSSLESARVPQILDALQSQAASASAKPIPSKVGDPSVLNHVIFVLKENRTYDQVLGDMTSGDGDPKLCTFPEKITPNHHEIAREFALLDNYYCNGVLSADGHTWAVEGNVTPYLEHAFGGFSRSYDFGTDPITYSSSGFMWDPILAKGKSFRNFGELEYPTLPNGWKLKDVWRAYESGDQTQFGTRCEIDKLKRYTARDFPGWEMAIPDVLRVDRFVKEFRQWEKDGVMPNFVIVYLPQDHTAGTNPGYPTPASYLADNDLAMGRLLDVISHSQFWKDSVLIANEDDPQAGYDHVDGHRSLCLVASPYCKRRTTVSQFYNQTSVIHTILRIFGIPALNQKIAVAPLMTDCFTETPDFTPYTARDPQVDRKKLNPPISALKGQAKKFAQMSAKMSFAHPDFTSEAGDDAMNRILWFAMKGNLPYPTKMAGAHGKGLKKKGLKLDSSAMRD